MKFGKKISELINLDTVARSGSVDFHTDAVLTTLNQVTNGGELIGCIVADVTDDVAEILDWKKRSSSIFTWGSLEYDLEQALPSFR